MLRLALLLPVLVLLPLGSARGDAIMVSRAMNAATIAEFFIEADRVRVELEIGLADLPAFGDLLPDGLREGLGLEAEPLEDRLARFFRAGLVIRADDGAPLPGRVVRMEPRPRLRRDAITGEPIPDEGEEELTIFAQLEYPFGGRPETLSFSPPGGGSASIGFVVYHLGLPVNDFRYLPPGSALDLDWGDPWYSRFRARALRRQYDAPLNAFLYVEPYEVRVEVIARPRDLQRWVDLGLAGRDSIPVELQPELERTAADFLARHFSLSIDGEPAQPFLDRVHFLRRTLRTSAVVDPREELDLVSATLGVIFVAPTRVALPRKAALTWDLFDERIQRVPGAATDEAGPLPYTLEPEDNVLRWENFLKNPTLPTLVEVGAPPLLPPLAVGLLGAVGLAASLLVGLHWMGGARRGRTPGRAALGVAGLLLVGSVALLVVGLRDRVDGERARQVVGGLLHNVYRSFDFREEEAIYDVLERSVAGDLLARTYLETRRGLELASQGGARVKVKEIELVAVEPESLGGGRGFRALCTWDVRGSVGHWGHVHTRTNRYRAELRIEPVDGVWKLTGLDLLSEERV